MPDSQPHNPILVSYKDLAKLMVKHEGLHEGLWGVYIRFGLRAANIPVQVEEHTSVMPAAILPILEIGIQPFAQATDLTIDAAVENPRPKRKGAKPSRKVAKKK